ncbi:hypothetical protein IQ277_00720 [Nostocales cyanobacterium LEGE 12452]|nr:hypothetical protein [Nostocales cyanobacterium LEGE 12452]
MVTEHLGLLRLRSVQVARWSRSRTMWKQATRSQRLVEKYWQIAQRSHHSILITDY